MKPSTSFPPPADMPAEHPDDLFERLTLFKWSLPKDGYHREEFIRLIDRVRSGACTAPVTEFKSLVDHALAGNEEDVPFVPDEPMTEEQWGDYIASGWEWILQHPAKAGPEAVRRAREFVIERGKP